MNAVHSRIVFANARNSRKFKPKCITTHLYHVAHGTNLIIIMLLSCKQTMEQPSRHPVIIPSYKYIYKYVDDGERRR